MQVERLKAPLGEVLFSQRSVRKFRPDPIPIRARSEPDPSASFPG